MGAKLFHSERATAVPADAAAQEHAVDWAELMSRLSWYGAVWPNVFQSTPAGVLSSVPSVCSRGKGDEPN